MGNLENAGPARSSEQAACPAPTPTRPKLLFLVTEDWYFCSHRLPVARAARDDGFEVVVATRVRDHGERIAGEGFRLCPLSWRRSGDGLIGAGRALLALARLYRRERPDIVHHVALKPVLFGAAARWLAFRGSGGGPAQIAAVMGLGSGPFPTSAFAPLLRHALGWAVRLAAADARIIVQNPEDRAALVGYGVAPRQIAVIRGSGVDTQYFTPMPEPTGPDIRVALVARMLRSKGVLDAVGAIRLLRARGLLVTLVLAGPTDRDNRDSLDEAALRAIAAEPGIEWLGRVDDVREVWRRAAIALMPSSYGEGVPKALLEAAACGRAIIASDMPGCREVVRHSKTGLLVPPHDVAALADAIATLADDRARRQRMGEAGRALAEREFTEDAVARDTLALYRQLLRDRRSTR